MREIPIQKGLHMKQEKYVILSNKPLTADVFEMTLEREDKKISDIRAGQFVNILIDSLYLRRPISVCDYENGVLTLVYKVVGAGTEKMSEMKSGTLLDVLTGLGNGYDLTKSGDAPLLVGGGVGVPPLYKAAKMLIKEGKVPTVILGFNKASEIFYEESFKKLGAEVIVATADGSYGVRGFVTDAIAAKNEDGAKFSYFYTCGPEPMLKAVYNCAALSDTDGEFSFEERMGCGFGACMGCSCETITGYKRICKDGPVMMKNEIKWKSEG